MPAPRKHEIAFTQQRLDQLPLPSAGRVFYHDAATRGLCIAVTAAGGKVFYLLRRIGGKRGRTVRVLLGKWPAMTADTARKAALRTWAAIDGGADPQEARQLDRKEATLAELWDAWKAYAEPRKKSFTGDVWLWGAYLESWGKRKLSAITSNAVAAHHAKVGQAHGHYSANRMLSLLRAMFGQSVRIGYRGDNPCVGVEKFREQSRDRFLSETELTAFFTALAAEPELFQDFFCLLLLTGARRGNVLSMAWADVDFDHGLWRIPMTKSGLPVLVPLVPGAAQVLRRRVETRKGSAWVFPSYGKSGHLEAPKGAWARIVSRAGLADCRPHDLRRTLGSYMAIGGASLPIVGKALGHRQSATTQIYARLTVAPVRTSMEAAANVMLATRKTTD